MTGGWDDQSFKAHDRASEDDRAWFAGHPGYRFRLRRAFPLETADPTSLAPMIGDLEEAWILVGQAKPGTRMRLSVKGRINIPNDDQAALEALFHAIARRSPLQAGGTSEDIWRQLEAPA